MLYTRRLPSMPSTPVSNRNIKDGLPPLHQATNSAWKWEEEAHSRGEHNHTPPIGHRSRPGDGFVYRDHGLRTPPPSIPPRMCGGDAIQSRTPSIGGQHYIKAPIAASNALPYESHQQTANALGSTSNHQPFYELYWSANRPQSPAKPRKEINAQDKETARGRASNDGHSIASHLQIPLSINDSMGSLPEFAAQITCFFWFESSYTLQVVEDAINPLSPTAPLVPEAKPTMGFLKWVTTILSMTQVTQNVILLALMFVYRLKKLNPAVKGKVGSEFRLLTVALMLGNKFLDDNTYTNKTWAEVSGISVQEIHVMEVEFLSNMRYTLFVTEVEWKAWHVNLGKFSDYYDEAFRIQSGLRNLILPLPFSSMPPNLPSPPISQSTSPAVLSQVRGLPHPLSSTLYFNQSMSSPVTPMVETECKSWPRKRSLDDHTSEPPSKRMSSMAPSAASSTTLTPSTLKSNTPPLPRLPMPNLSITTGNSSNAHSSFVGQLPMSSALAMSTVFSGSHGGSHSGMQLPSLQPSNHSSQPGSSKGLSPSSVNDYTKRPPPYNNSSKNGSATPSPTSYYFPQNNTPNGLSPSGFPVPRPSPYKPVRGVNTLLVPPPSASMHNSQNFSYDQMHYQPLGQPKSERRTGVLPYNTLGQPQAPLEQQYLLPHPRPACA